MKKLNNTVIKNLTPEMGKRIIKKYQNDGWDTGSSMGNSCEIYGCKYIYYGVIGSRFEDYSLEQVRASNARIIELDEWQPVRGERVLAWDSKEVDAESRIYLTTIEGALYPIVTVEAGHEYKFEKGEPFEISAHKHMKRIETKTELQELEAKYRELGEQIEKLKNK